MTMVPGTVMYLGGLIGRSGFDTTKIGAHGGSICATRKAQGQRCKGGRSDQTLCHAMSPQDFLCNGRPMERLKL